MKVMTSLRMYKNIIAPSMPTVTQTKKNSTNGNGNGVAKPPRTKLTLSQRAADGLTHIMGSWGFISLFILYLLVWMALNVVGIVASWDPYPFILLNLTLSCLAALQAPIILMSQNRTTERDRVRAEYDYAVNRKAEREIQQIQQDLDEIKKLLKK